MDLNGQQEREFLKRTIRQTFENPKEDNGKIKPKRQLTVNQNRDNYDTLAEEISTVAEKLATRKLKERVKVAHFGVSAHQLRSLFTESKTGFRDYFVEACYLYAHGVERQIFMDKDENADLINSWEQDKPEPLPPQYADGFDDLKAENMALHDQKTALENALTAQKEVLEKEQKDNERRRRWMRRAQRAAAIVGLVLLSVFGYNAFKASQKVTVWAISTPWDGGASGRSKLIEDIVKQVYERTNGQFVIHIYHNGYLPNSTGKAVEKLSDLFTAVAEGTIQMAHYSPYYSFKVRPADVFFCSMPGGMKHQEMDNWLREGDGQALWQQLYKPYGVLPFSCGHTGEQMGGWFKKEIKNTADFQDLHFRIGSPIGGLVLKSFGAIVDTEKIGEWQIVRKMAKNELDGAEFIGASDDYQLGMAGIRGFNYYYRSHWHEPNTMNAMLVNQAAFEQLSKDFQDKLVAAIDKFGGEMAGNLKSENEKQEKYIIENIKEVQILPFPNDVEKALQQRAVEQINEFVDKNKNDTLFMRIFHSYKKHCSSCGEWRN